ncbi:MAG: hypothetical protein FWF59_01535 [Turicibacter sp.]|nr:hypothetical protein [Turicibacter sp.]
MGLSTTQYYVKNENNLAAAAFQNQLRVALAGIPFTVVAAVSGDWLGVQMMDGFGQSFEESLARIHQTAETATLGVTVFDSDYLYLSLKIPEGDLLGELEAGWLDHMETTKPKRENMKLWETMLKPPADLETLEAILAKNPVFIEETFADLLNLFGIGGELWDEMLYALVYDSEQGFEAQPQDTPSLFLQAQKVWSGLLEKEWKQAVILEETEYATLRKSPKGFHVNLNARSPHILGLMEGLKQVNPQMGYSIHILWDCWGQYWRHELPEVSAQLDAHLDVLGCFANFRHSPESERLAKKLYQNIMETVANPTPFLQFVRTLDAEAIAGLLDSEALALKSYFEERAKNPLTFSQVEMLDYLHLNVAGPHLSLAFTYTSPQIQAIGKKMAEINTQLDMSHWQKWNVLIYYWLKRASPSMELWKDVRVFGDEIDLRFEFDHGWINKEKAEELHGILRQLVEAEYVLYHMAEKRAQEMGWPEPPQGTQIQAGADIVAKTPYMRLTAHLQGYVLRVDIRQEPFPTIGKHIQAIAPALDLSHEFAWSDILYEYFLETAPDLKFVSVTPHDGNRFSSIDPHSNKAVAYKRFDHIKALMENPEAIDPFVKKAEAYFFEDEE